MALAPLRGSWLFKYYDTVSLFLLMGYLSWSSTESILIEGVFLNFINKVFTIQIAPYNSTIQIANKYEKITRDKLSANEEKKI